LLDDLFIYFCRQALSLKPPASLERRLCHPLGQNGGHSRPSWQLHTFMENARESRLVKNMELMKRLGDNLSKLERIPL